MFNTIFVIYNMNHSFFTLLLVSVVLLSGCTTLSPQKLDIISAETSGNACPLTPEQVTQFALRGKIGIKLEEKGVFGQFFWHHNRIKNNDYLLFYNPLGQVIAGVYQEEVGVRFFIDGKNEFTHTPESLMQAKLGWFLPLNSLHYWVLMKPDPNSWATLNWNEFNQVKQIKQNHWTIDYLEYQLVNILVPSAGISQGVYNLPKVIRLQHQTQNLEIKLILQDWQFDSVSKM